MPVQQSDGKIILQFCDFIDHDSWRLAALRSSAELPAYSLNYCRQGFDNVRTANIQQPWPSGDVHGAEPLTWHRYSQTFLFRRFAEDLRCFRIIRTYHVG